MGSNDLKSIVFGQEKRKSLLVSTYSKIRFCSRICSLDLFFLMLDTVDKLGLERYKYNLVLFLKVILIISPQFF